MHFHQILSKTTRVKKLHRNCYRSSVGSQWRNCTSQVNLISGARAEFLSYESTDASQESSEDNCKGDSSWGIRWSVMAREVQGFCLRFCRRPALRADGRRLVGSIFTVSRCTWCSWWPECIMTLSPSGLTCPSVCFKRCRYGEIMDVNLVRDKATGKSRGFAFLAYEDQRSTVLAVGTWPRPPVRLWVQLYRLHQCLVVYARRMEHPHMKP